MYPVTSEYVFLAWSLIDAFPDPIKQAPVIPPSNSTDTGKGSYKEPTDDALVSYINSFPLLPNFELLETYVLPISVDEVWDNFYADVSLFYSNEGF